MNALYYLSDFKNSQSFVVIKNFEGGDQTAATFAYNEANKKAMRKIAGVFVWIMNLLYSN